jgi:filamentous hemagglutinin family protein
VTASLAKLRIAEESLALRKREDDTLALAIRHILAGGLLCLAPAAQALDTRLPVPAQTWVSAGQAGKTANGSRLTIQQQTDRVTLNWRSFDIGKDAGVTFQQPSVSSIALNRIGQAGPSEIFGQLTANGQIYLVNHNGFVFGEASQVNTNTLVATTLDISDEVFLRGITKVIGQDGSAALNGSGAVYLRDADGNYLLDAQGQKQKIQIYLAPGAQVKTSNGGRVLLAAPKVDNQGGITTPDGQTLLVAGTDKVYLQEAGPDSDVRGLLVEVKTGGEASNSGSINVGKGNATLLGFAVNQNGLISAKTSVRSNGSIRLLARENAQALLQDQSWLLQGTSTRRDAAGEDGLGERATVKLGKGSVTEILPDSGDGSTAVDSQAQDPSRVAVQGNVVAMAGGALIHAPAGQVELSATEHPDNPGQTGISNDSRIQLDAGSKIDVAGLSGVAKPMDSNVVKVELRSNELRDSPLQRKGILNGKTVYVDVRQGTPLADISGAVAQIGRTVDERSTAGGSVALHSEGAVVANAGSLVDVSGGSVAYQSGTIRTTQLVADDGSIVDISQADPNRRYVAVLGDLSTEHARWGITDRWGISGPIGQGLFQAGYSQGINAGSVDVQANQLLLDGRILAATQLDLLQRYAQPPLGGSLSIDLARAPDSLQDILLQSQAGSTLLGLDEAFPQDGQGHTSPLLLAANRFFADGVSRVALKTQGALRLAQDALLRLQEGGSFSADAGQMELAGAIQAPGGSVALQTRLAAGNQDVVDGSIALQPGASIDVGGVFVNDTGVLQTPHRFAPAAINGGSVAITTDQGDLSVAAGAAIRADGGAWLDQRGQVTAGRGGSIALESAGIDGSNLKLGGTLSAYALEQGGTLSLTTHEIRLGAAATAAAPSSNGLVPLRLLPAFFTQGGFSQYNLASNLSGITVEDKAQIHPQTQNLLFNSDPRLLASGSAMRAISHPALLPDTLRQPANLSLNLVQSVGHGGDDAGLHVGSQASLSTDPRGSITLNSDASIYVQGSLSAPAGTVALTITTPKGVLEPGFLPNQGIWLEKGSKISAAGTALLQSDALGLTRGQVLDGGSISLTANRGSIVTAPGSSLDVSGTSAWLVQPGPAQSGQAALPVSVRMASAGGSIVLAAAEGMLLGGGLNGQGGAGETTADGSLSVTVNPNLRLEPVDPLPPDQQFLRNPPVILLTRREQDVLTQEQRDSHALPLEFNGQVRLSGEQIDQGHFAHLSFSSTQAIRFQDAMDLSVSGRLLLDAPQIQWGGTEAGAVGLQASYIALGSSQFRAPVAAPVAGNGSLSAQAQLIDLVGGLGLDGFSATQLSSQGDIRLRGIRVNDSQRDFVGQLRSAGDLTLSSAQVYTTTLSDYTLQVTGVGGSLRFAGNGADTGPVLSVGGKLTALADRIEQDGVVKAPQGEIRLQAGQSLQLTPGSRISVSLDGALVPFGRTQGGLDWLYPLDLQNLVLDGPPQKIITLSAPKLALDDKASVDLSGGGDLYAFEFIKGPGGSVDILDPHDPAVMDGSVAYQEKYAILPSVGAYAPYDPLEFPASGLQVGDSVYLAGGSGLPAGTYALLPAHYALLPGAYLVTPTDLQDMTPGQVVAQPDGSQVVAGYRSVAGTELRDARWSGFAVAPGSLAKTYSEYQESYANQFFADQAQRLESNPPLLPQDAGRLVLQATQSLALDGQVLARAANGGIGGRLDVDATRLTVAPRGILASDGSITLAAEDLMDMELSSLLLGGVREESADGTRVTTTAQSVAVAAGTQLAKAELLLTAQESLYIGANAQLRATAADTAAPSQNTAVTLDGNSAQLRLSNGPQAVLTSQDYNSADLTVESGALLSADGSVLLNAGGSVRLDGKLASQGGSVQLGAGRISLGDAPADSKGLVLDNAMLQGIQAEQLVLSSANPINLYGSASLQQHNLVLDAAGLAGQGGAGDTATLAADSLTFSNHYAAKSFSAAGSGKLQVTAAKLVLGAGDYRLAGFQHISLQGSQTIAGQGSATLHALADLSLQAGQFTGGNGADTRIDATGYQLDTSSPSGKAKDAGTAGLGARWSLTADAIQLAGQHTLPAGQLQLDALQGDVLVAEGARIDVAGRALPLAGSTVYADAGLVNLVAEQGDIRLAKGAAIDLSAAAGGGNAGTLKLSAAQGQVDLQADLSAGAGAQALPGSFYLDAQTLAAVQLAQLTQNLAADGFANILEIRQRQGDMAIPAGATLKAQTIRLSADQGELQLAGTLNASAAQGGTVELAGGHGVSLAGGSAILARATADGQNGGSVLLDASIGDAAAAGSITLASGSLIDVSGAGQGVGGKVTLRAMRQPLPSGIAIATPAGSISGAVEVTVEGVAVYQQDSGTITSSDIAAWQTATSQYMQNAAAIEQRLGGGITLVPALDVRSDGDLTLVNAWNLLSWRYHGQPGSLTLRAGGDLKLQANLTDAFANGAISTPFGDMPVNNLLQPGLSWSYRLLADGSIKLAKGVMLRTGTGSISLDAGQDVQLGQDNSAGNNAVIYTAGRPTNTDRYGSFSNAIVGFLFYGEYPVDGGDIDIRAGRNIVGAAGPQLISDWLVRTGSWSSEGAVGNTLPTAWAINLQTSSGSGSAFKEGIGALGGGNVTVDAGGDINDLSVLIPTTGKQVGQPNDPGNVFDLSFSTNQVQVQGGGNLQVQAAGNINGGLYYTGAGNASVGSGGSIGASKAPWFALGDGRLSASAGGDLTVGGVFNPTMLPQSAETAIDNISSFFTYSAASAASFLSRASSVVLRNDVEGLIAGSSLDGLADTNSSHMLQVYPGQVQATAPAGDIRIERDFLLYPSASGRLALLAGGSIGTADTGNAVTVTQSDADPALLPNWLTPAQDLTDAYNRLQPYGNADLIHAAQPLHAGDARRAEIIAQSGDIAGQDPLRFVLATAVYAYAGHDLNGVSIDAQNNNATDISEILAGRDIRYITERDPLTGNLLNLTQQIGLSGPGQLQVMAGRNIDLGSSEGIVTLGTQLNPALPQGGAAITVLAGLTAHGIATLDDQSGPLPIGENRAADFSGSYAAFIQTYLENSPAYQEALLAYMQPYGAEASATPQQALARFKTLPANAQRKFLLDVMYEELRQAGSAAAKDPSVGNQRGFDAIAALFPGQGYQGDLTLFFSKIHSVDGGDIDIAVPGGLVNAGLAVAFSGAKPASDLGIVAQRYGAINAVVDGDFLVNQSRVFALDGGDITLWSSNGNIDAGRGAKTSLSVPPPIVSFDAKGNLQVIFPPVVSGSGIRTAASSLDKVPGDVYLFAPKGVVDAGEAGIGGNNITIGATAVIGAANIQVGGSSTGVPVAPTVNVGAIAGAGNVASSVAQNAQQTAGTGMERATEKNLENSLSAAILDVDVLGWGD